MNGSRDASRAAVVAREALILVAYFALTAAATYPLITRFASAVPPGGDTWVFYWNLWWVKRALLDLGRTPFFTPELFFPFGANLYFHTLNLLPSVLALPLTAAIGPTVAYNVLVFFAFVLGGYGMYRLALYVMRHIDPREVGNEGPRITAAFLSGLTFTFSSYHFAHLHGHLDLVSIQWLPLYVLFVLRTRDDPRLANVCLCAAFLAATVLTALYHALFLLVFTALFAAHTLLTRRSDAAPALRRIALAVAIGIVLSSPLLVPMVIHGRIGGRSFDPLSDTVRFSTDAILFGVPSPLHPLWGRPITKLYQNIFGRSAGYEQVAFLGYVPAILATVAAFRHGQALSLWIAGLVLFALLALGPVLHVGGFVVPGASVLMPYRWLASLPYGDIPRVPGRFVVMVIVCVSVMAAVGAWHVLGRISAARRRPLTIALAAIALFENAAVPLQTMAVDAPRFFDVLARDPARGGVLEVPIPDDPASVPIRMLFQTRHGKPVFGGYISRGQPPLRFDAVPGFRELKALSLQIDDVIETVPDRSRDIARAALAAYGAARVVIEKRFFREAAEIDHARTIAETILGPSARDYEDDFVVSYSVPQEPAPLSALWLDTGWSYLEHRSEQNSVEHPAHWRWMGERARVAVLAGSGAGFRLRMRLVAFKRVRHVRLSTGASEITVVQVGTEEADYVTPVFRRSPGTSFIDLESLEGAESPGTDPRLLSVALMRIDLIETP